MHLLFYYLESSQLFLLMISLIYSTIFLDFQLSYRFCRDFFDMLQKMSMLDFGSTDCLCTCLDRMTSYSRDGDIYHSYLLNYKSALTYLDYLRNTLEDYATYERVCFTICTHSLLLLFLFITDNILYIFTLL